MRLDMFPILPAVSVSKLNFMMSMFNLSAVLVEQSHVAGEITITLRTASPAAVCPCYFCVHCVQTDLCSRIQCVGRKSFRAENGNALCLWMRCLISCLKMLLGGTKWLMMLMDWNCIM